MPKTRMYQFRCHTCEENHLKEDLQSAQAVFNAHAEHQHEVVLERVELQQDGTSSSGGATTASKPVEPGDSTTDDHTNKSS